MTEAIISVGPYIQIEQRARDIQFALYGPVTCAEFHGVRNRLLALLRAFGSVGPMGEFSLKPKCSYLERGDPGLGRVDRHPDFFVVDAQYSDRNRWHRVEADWSTVTPACSRSWWLCFETQTGGGCIWHWVRVDCW
jgi:hypothetical protein